MKHNSQPFNPLQSPHAGDALKESTRANLIIAIFVIGSFCLSAIISCSNQKHPKEYNPNTHPDKKLELLANVIAFEKKHYSVSDMCLTFRRGDKYEYEYPKSHIKWILMNGFDNTNRADFADIEAGHYIDLGSFQMHFDDGYFCVNFPKAKTPNELSDAMVEYIVELLKTAFERKKVKK